MIRLGRLEWHVEEIDNRTGELIDTRRFRYRSDAFGYTGKRLKSDPNRHKFYFLVHEVQVIDARSAAAS